MNLLTINKEATLAAVNALLHSFDPGISHEAENKLVGIITDIEEPFLVRAGMLDNWVAENPKVQELEEVLFDLLLVHFLSAETHHEEYFESADWAEIENKILDRGTEMLNLFLYLGEARETEAKVGLDDFLNEFLLVGEDEFQDEYRIYESLIVNNHLLDADLGSLRELQKKVKPDTGIQEYFVPIVLFFQFADDPSQQQELCKGLPLFELAILNSLIAYQSL